MLRRTNPPRLPAHPTQPYVETPTQRKIAPKQPLVSPPRSPDNPAHFEKQMLLERIEQQRNINETIKKEITVDYDHFCIQI